MRLTHRLGALTLFTLSVAAFSTVSANECKFSEDPFQGTESVALGTEMSLSESPIQTLLVYQREGDSILYVLAALYAFDDWKFLGEEAYDSDHNELPHIIGDRRTLDDGSVLESVQIQIDKSYIEAQAAAERVPCHSQVEA